MFKSLFDFPNMLFPANDVDFWENFNLMVGTFDSLTLQLFKLIKNQRFII